MRIESLLIERYGIHADRRLEFAPGLQVIHGPNEAGKTTLLQLVRDLFFGFEHVHPYRLDSHTGPLKATAWCVTQSGREFWFSRQKGRPDVLFGEIRSTPDKVDAQVLERLIGRISPSTYRQLFAFSLEELRKGGEVLSEEGLQRALFGAGMGGLPQFQALQQRLQLELEGLLKVHGQAKKPVINDLAIQIQKAKDAYRQATLRPHEYARQVDAVRRQETRVAELGDRLAALLQEQSRLTRYQRALPSYRQCEALRASLSELPRPGTYPADAIDRFEKLQGRLTELAAELAALQESGPQLADSSQTAIDDERLLHAAAEIRSLRGQYDLLIAQGRKQSALKDQVKSAHEELRMLLRELPDGWSRERLASVQVAPQDVATLKSIEQELAERTQTLRGLDEKVADLAAQVESLSRWLEANPDDPRLLALESLLEGREQHWNTRSRLVEVQRRIDELCDRLDALRRELCVEIVWKDRVPQDAAELLAITPPPVVAIDDIERQWERLEVERSELRTSLQREESELRQARLSLEDLLCQREIPVAGRLSILREQRDAAWKDLKAHLLVSGDLPATDRTSEYERIVQECDAFADELLKSAADVARRSELEVQVARRQQAVDESKTRLSALNAAVGELQVRWLALWQASGISPLAPPLMRPWLDRFTEFREEHAELVKCEREELHLEVEIGGAERELIKAFADSSGIADAWRRAQQLRDILRGQQAERARQRQEHHDLSGRHFAAEQQRYEAALEVARLQQRALGVLEPYQLPSTWDVATARRTLEDLIAAARRQRDINDLEQFLSEQDQEWRGFHGQLTAVLNRAAPDLTSRSDDEALTEVETRLETAESRASHRRHREERESHSERDRLELMRKQRDAEEQLAQLAAECSVSTAELGSFFEQVAAAGEMSARIRAIELQIEAALQPGETQQSLASYDLDVIASRLHTLEAEIRECQREHSTAQQEFGVQRRDLEAIERDEQPLRLAAEIAGLQARLTHAVDEWAPLALADGLMTAARERFEQLHQPRLIAEVSRIFRQMTCDAYPQIDCSLDPKDEHPLKVRHRDGELRNTTQLSSGTAEQLYLAIRLAYVTDYQRSSEPMPMVMDDVLVNFDEPRALQTLHLLLDLSRSTQVLFLTCHRRTIDLLHRLQPQANLIELGGSPDLLDSDMFPDGNEFAETEAEARRSTRRPKRRMERPDQPALFPPSN